MNRDPRSKEFPDENSDELNEPLLFCEMTLRNSDLVGWEMQKKRIKKRRVEGWGLID
jgi:hypothetical protein